ncbi:MAG: 23S rRNA (pseudouridine(1915)-N(3))-methyltransferase RlmH [Ruminococcus sp.]|nr:23S rRNA (pseudouridine(1915)-N(3))-methyltransferase RlmH [Ruminococcus sp.]
MFNINIIAVGKLKEDYLKSACGEYIKRLGAYCRVKIAEIPESRLSSDPLEKEIENALIAEGENILAALPKNGAAAAMCIEGKQMGSEEFAERLEKFASEGKSTVSFIIGSSYGLSDGVKAAADIRMSMSAMTFPHQLARVMLLEQIYRAVSILNNGKYHK